MLQLTVKQAKLKKVRLMSQTETLNLLTYPNLKQWQIDMVPTPYTSKGESSNLAMATWSLKKEPLIPTR